ncbi:MAG: hypothetical protein NWF13_03330 [Candidatus Bathyarchaeota archaeon]|nr:hypothetical protein [Candidatus Bathyarchaeota archaeon]
MKRSILLVSLMLVIVIPFSAYALATFDDVSTEKRHDDSSDMTPFTAVVNRGRSVDVYVPVDMGDGLTEEEAALIAEVTFTTVMGHTRIHRLDTLTLKEAQMTAHYSWGYNENDLGHVFDMIVDLITLQITVSHCF